MFCLEKTSLHPTLGLHGHGVFSLCLSSWEHPQTAESWKFPFPLCQKDLNAPFRARSSHHITGQGCPAGTETHFKLRGAQRRSEGSSAPLPSLPRALHCDEATVPRDARSLQERHRPGWLRLLWGELLSVSPAISLQIHPQRGILSSRLQSQAVPFPNKWNESDRKGWRKSSCFQKRGLELRSPSFPQAGDRNGAPAWRRRPSPGGGIPTFWLLLQQTPSLLVRNRKSQPERLQHLIPEARLDSSFTILFIFSNQWEKWTSSTWKLAQFYLIATSFCFATLILHVPKLKCFISSYRQLFI